MAGKPKTEGECREKGPVCYSRFSFFLAPLPGPADPRDPDEASPAYIAGRNDCLLEPSVRVINNGRPDGVLVRAISCLPRRTSIQGAIPRRYSGVLPVRYDQSKTPIRPALHGQSVSDSSLGREEEGGHDAANGAQATFFYVNVASSAPVGGRTSSCR